MGGRNRILVIHGFNPSQYRIFKSACAGVCGCIVRNVFPNHVVLSSASLRGTLGWCLLLRPRAYQSLVSGYVKR